MSKSNIKHQWLTALYTTIALFIYWLKIIINSHQYLFGSNTEGIKGYFNILYYALYDEGLVLTGFNYPYGEQLVNTDGQIALSWPFSLLLNGNFEYATNVITILNLLLFFSIPIASVYLFKIFSLWKIPNLYASSFAVAITLLCPQILYISNQHSLSYICFFPMLWFYAANWLQNKSKTSLFLFALTLILFTFIDYLYAIVTFFFIAFSVLFYFIYKFKNKGNLLRAGILFLLTLLPVASYYIWATSGLSADNSYSISMQSLSEITIHLRDIFVPFGGFVKNGINIFFPIQNVSLENYSYIGLAAIISALSGIWVLRDRVLEKEFLASSLGVFLLASIACLIISMGFVFKYLPSSWTIVNIADINSLRILAVPFYFVFATAGAWLLFILSEYIRKKGQSFVATAIVAIVFSLWMYEGMALQKHQATYIKENGKLVDKLLSFDNSFKKQLLDIGKNPDYYQAVLAFPYLKQRNEPPANINYNNKTFFYAAKAALEMQIPIAGNYRGGDFHQNNSRFIQLMSHPFIEKEILKDFKDDRSILLIAVGDKFEAHEQRLINQSRVLIQTDKVTLYDLPLSAFTQQQPNTLDSPYSTLLKNGIQYQSSKLDNFLWKDFKGIRREKSNELIASYEIKNSNQNDDIEVSLWYDLQASHSQTVLYADVLNKENRIINRYICRGSSIRDIYKNMARANITIPYNSDNHIIKVVFSGSATPLHSLLVRPSNQDIWIKKGGENKFFNNYPISN